MLNGLVVGGSRRRHRRGGRWVGGWWGRGFGVALEKGVKVSFLASSSLFFSSSFESTCQPHCYLMALQAKAEVGGDRKTMRKTG